MLEHGQIVWDAQGHLLRHAVGHVQGHMVEHQVWGMWGHQELMG